MVMNGKLKETLESLIDDYGTNVLDYVAIAKDEIVITDVDDFIASIASKYLKVTAHYTT